MKPTKRFRLTRTTLLFALCAGLGYFAKGVVDKPLFDNAEKETKAALDATNSNAEARDGSGVELSTDAKVSIESFRYEDASLNASTRAVEYAQELDFDPIYIWERDIFRLKMKIVDGQYDELFEEIQDDLKTLDFLNQKGIVPPQSARYRIHLLAVALELKGDWERAIRVYSFLYPCDRELMSWVYVRKLYSEGRAELAFERTVDAIEGLLLDGTVDEIVGDYLQLRADPVVGDRAILMILGNSQYRRLYCLLDQLLQITSPKFHYNEGYKGKFETRFAKSNREAREAFKTFLETESAKYAADPRRSEEEKERVEKATVFLRKLVNLP